MLSSRTTLFSAPVSSSTLGRKEIGVNDKERQEWSRHYDNLQWAVVTIVSAGAGALFVTSFGSDGKNHIWPDVSGLALTVIGLVYVASFRRFRANLHGQMENEQLRDFLANPGQTWFSQWLFFAGTFFALDIAFIYRIAQKTTCPSYGWFISLLLFLLALFFVLIMKEGKAEKR